MEKEVTINANEEQEIYFDDLLASVGNDLLSMQPGSTEYTETARTLCDMYKTKLDFEKIEREYEDREKQRFVDIQLQRTTADRNRNLKLLEVGVSIATTAAVLAVYCFWQRQGYKFEEHGTITSSTFRRHNGLIDKFIKPKI